MLGMMGPRDFLGGECLVENSRRTSAATCLELSTVFQIEKRAMLRAIHLQPQLSGEFVASLLARNINIEEDLCDQLFNHSELRLACTLLKLARAGRRARPGSLSSCRWPQKACPNRGHHSVEDHFLYE